MVGADVQAFTVPVDRIAVTAVEADPVPRTGDYAAGLGSLPADCGSWGVAMERSGGSGGSARMNAPQRVLS